MALLPVVTLLAASLCLEPGTQPATRLAASPDASTGTRVVELPGIVADLDARELRLEAEMLHVDMPLEYVCVVTGTADHEALVRTRVRPSDVHAAALMIGLEPGQPLRWSEQGKTFLPPTGAPVRLELSWESADGPKRMPVERLMTHVESGEPMPARVWVFAGSRLAPDGTYIADLTGQVVSLVNFENALFDVPTRASDRNELLEWKTNTVIAPPAGAAVTLHLVAVGEAAFLLATTAPSPTLSDTPTTQPNLDARIEALREEWEREVGAGSVTVRQAAQRHYETVQSLRVEQDRLLDEVERLQRVIDELERSYQDLVTPRPAAED